MKKFFVFLMCSQWIALSRLYASVLSLVELHSVLGWKLRMTYSLLKKGQRNGIERVGLIKTLYYSTIWSRIYYPGMKHGILNKTGMGCRGNRDVFVCAQRYPWCQKQLTMIHPWLQGFLSPVHIFAQGTLNEILPRVSSLIGLPYIHAIQYVIPVVVNPPYSNLTHTLVSEL